MAAGVAQLLGKLDPGLSGPDHETARAGDLVVGTGQSGVQLAEELRDAGRHVFLSVGTAGRIPRRYRGRDFFHWMHALLTDGPRHGIRLPAVEELPDPRMRLTANPHLSGHDGGHDTNLRAYAADGSMTLIGRIQAADGERLTLADDLPTKLAFADAFFAERFQPQFDAYIERAGIDAPPDEREAVAFEPPVPRTLDLAAEGIASVLWTTGYVRDYGWIAAPIADELGFPGSAPAFRSCRGSISSVRSGSAPRRRRPCSVSAPTPASWPPRWGCRRRSSGGRR